MNRWTLFVADPLRKKAIFCQALLGLLALPLTWSRLPYTHSAFSAVLSVFFAFYMVWLIYVLRGEEKQSRTKPHVVTSIGVWGYFWRCVLIYYLAVSGVVLGVLMLGFRPISPPPLLWMASLNIAIAFVMPGLCWLLFSSDRKGQLLWVVSSVR